LYARVVGAVALSATPNRTDVEVVPLKLEAIIEYVIYPWLVLGVPDIAQEVLSILNPAGIAGEIVHAVGTPPAIVGVRVVILTVLAKIKEAVL
jgi:hypothetical protein